MTIKNLILTAVIVLTATSSYARIGETLDESIARYGKVKATATYDAAGNPSETGSEKLYHFVKNDIEVTVGFSPEGKAWRISYSKYARYGDKSELTPNEITNLLEAEKGDGKWKFIGELPGDGLEMRGRWENGDRNASYVYNMKSDIMHWCYKLNFWTNENENAHKALVKAETAKAMSEF